MFVRGRAAGLSAAAGSFVAVNSASTIACGPGLAFTLESGLSSTGFDHATPVTFEPVRYLFAGGVPSAADTLDTSISPPTASASCLASGLHASPSGWGSFELTRFGAEPVGLGRGAWLPCGDGLTV